MTVGDKARTHCPYCSLNCGLDLETAGGKVVGYDRWKGAPLSRGGLCSKGASAYQQVHHPDRLLEPLVRHGGSLVPVGWEEALDRVAEGFLEIRDRCGPGANAVFGSGSLSNERAYLVGKFARLALRTPHVDPNGRLCMTSAGAAAIRAFGIDRAMTPLSEMLSAETIVVVGTNLPESFPLAMPLVMKARRKGTRLIVVDPRGGSLVRDGDVHLPVRPGTDAALAAGLLCRVGLEGGIDWGFVDTRTRGFHEAWEAVQGWDLERTSEVTGVPGSDIARAAERLAESDTGMIIHGRGLEQQVVGVNNVLSWINLGLACGFAGRPGCGILPMTGQRNGQGGREHGQRCDQLPGYRDVEDPEARRVIARRWGVEEQDLPGRGLTYVEILRAAREREIRGLLVMASNPAVSAPRSSGVLEALRRLDHLVVVDPFLSETAVEADVVLPGSTFAEDEGTVTTTEGRVVRLNRAIGNVPMRGDLDILRALATRLGVREHFDFHRGREVFEELTAVSEGGVADYSGLTWESVEGEGVFWPAPRSRPEGTPLLHTEGFAHPDGRARFSTVTPLQPPVQPDADYPLVLTTARHRSHYLSGNQTRRIEAQMKRSPEPVLELHPDTAAAVGAVDGEPVEVVSRQGAITLAWTTNDALREDTCFVPYHWPGINGLTSDALDPVSRIAGVKHTPVRVTPVRAAAEVSVPQRWSSPLVGSSP